MFFFRAMFRRALTALVSSTPYKGTSRTQRCILRYKSTFSCRTHFCGDLTAQHVNSQVGLLTLNRQIVENARKTLKELCFIWNVCSLFQVRVCGWIDSLRMDKFILLRDDGSNSRLQLIVPPDKKSLWLKLNTLTLESVLDVRYARCLDSFTSNLIKNQAFWLFNEIGHCLDSAT